MRSEETGRCLCCGRLDACGCTGEPDCHPEPSPLPILVEALNLNAARRNVWGRR